MAGITADKLMTALHPGIIMILFGILVMLLPRGFRKPLAIIAPVTASWAFLQMSEKNA